MAAFERRLHGSAHLCTPVLKIQESRACPSTYLLNLELLQQVKYSSSLCATVSVVPKSVPGNSLFNATLQHYQLMLWVQLLSRDCYIVTAFWGGCVAAAVN